MLFEAYLNEFSSNDNVELIVLSSFSKIDEITIEYYSQAQRIFKADSFNLIPSFEIINEFIPSDRMPMLYRFVDVFVHAVRTDEHRTIGQGNVFLATLGHELADLDGLEHAENLFRLRCGEDEIVDDYCFVVDELRQDGYSRGSLDGFFGQAVGIVAGLRTLRSTTTDSLIRALGRN